MPVLGSLLFQIFLVVLLDGIWIRKYREMIVSYQIVYLVKFITLIYGCYVLGEMALFWAYPLCLSIIFIVSNHFIKYFLVVSYVVTCVAAYLLIGGEEIIHFSISLLLLCLICYYLEKIFVRSESTLMNIVHRDPLTNAYNSKFMDDVLTRVVGEMNNGYAPSSLISFTLNGFQDLKDKLGIRERDKALVDIIEQVQAKLRKTDYLFRTGNFEFVILLKNTTQSQALSYANELTSLVQSLSREKNYGVISQMGVSEYHLEENAESWLIRIEDYLINATQMGNYSIYPTSHKINENIYSPYPD